MDTPRPAHDEREVASPGEAAGDSATAAWLVLLLDPRSIQRLLIVGGGLAVAGLVATLASLGVFDDARVVAVALGTGTAAILGVGWAVSLRTPYRLAGQALTFLGCLAAPLNLWYYDWQGLVTVDGHLWVGGVVCCLVYLVTVRLLKDPVFLYAVEAGVSLTVLLILGDVQRANDSSWVCVALVTLGVVSVLAERVFADRAEFDRRRFGRPLFLAGQAQLAAAAVALLILQALAAGGVPATIWGWDLARSTLASSAALPAGLWLALAGAWIYSDLVVLRSGRLAAPAAVAILLAAATLLDGRLDAPEMILLAATAGFACMLGGRRLATGSGDLATAIGPAWSSAGGLILTVAACAALMERGFDLLRPDHGLAGLIVTGLVPLATAVVVAAGSLVTRSAAARRGYLFAAGAIALATVGGWIRLLHLAPYQKLELTAAVAGLMLFAAGCGGRVREREGQRDESVTLLLWMGSVAAILPALWVVLQNRWFGSGPSRFDELLLVTVVLPTLVLGCVLQVRSATLVAGGGLALYLVTVFANLVWRPDLAVSVYLGVGGAVIFLTGILLSVWRDRLLALPRQIAAREGVFQVMRWR